MKNLILLLLLINGFFLSGQNYNKMISSGKYSLKEIQESAKIYFEEHGTGKGSGYKQFKRWEYNAKRLCDENGYLKSKTEYIDALKAKNKAENLRPKRAAIQTSNWVELGPITMETGKEGYNPGVGRITTMAIDQKDTNHMIIGAATGGVWKTTDKGLSWIPLCDNFPDMDVSALAMDPKNSKIYYWGSSNGKLYRSLNAGATWKPLRQISSLGDEAINKIVIHPTNPKIMLISMEGYGHYISTNRGVTWSKLDTEDTGYDIVFKPNQPNTIYATGKSFHRSTDGGATWTTVTKGFKSSPKRIGVSPADVNTVYILEAKPVTIKHSSFSGIYVSKNSGTSFVKKNHTGNNYFGESLYASGFWNKDSGNAPRDMSIAVSPTNINEIFIASINPYRSLDGGDTFEITAHWYRPNRTIHRIGFCHADIPYMVYQGSELFVNSDGGIYVAKNPSGKINKKFYTDMSTGLGIQQFYKLGVSQTKVPVLVAGSQDNGLNTKGTGKLWKHWHGADGMECFVNELDPDHLIGSIQFGKIYESFDGGETATEFNTLNLKGDWVTPVEQATQNSDHLIYMGYDKVYLSTNGGLPVQVSQEFTSLVTQLKIAPSNNQVIYAATTNALYRTTTGTVNNKWDLIKTFKGDINSIAIHPKDPNKIAVATTSNFKVYVSSNGGKNWKIKRKGLSTVFSALALVWDDNDKDALYLGMNYGVYYIDNTLTEWQTYSNLLPNVEIRELEINHAEGMLYAATYGRGAWKTSLYNNLAGRNMSPEAIISPETLSIFPNPVESDVTISLNRKQQAEIRLFDVNGELMFYSRKEAVKTKTIDMSGFSSGVYFLRVSTETGVITKKVLKN